MHCLPVRRNVVVEDAVSGVKAAKDGNFGFVIGISRDESRMKEKKLLGADVVVNDLGEINIQQIDEWFDKEIDNKDIYF